MWSNLRVLSVCVIGGLLAGFAFFGAIAVANHQFGDVGTNNPFHEEISWLTDQGLATGFPDGTFDPQGRIKRQQAAFWFANYNDAIYLTESPIDPPAGQTFSGQAGCADDDRAVAGGGVVDQASLRDDVAIVSSFPTREEGDVDNQWSVEWQTEDDDVVDPTLTIWALCMPPIATIPDT